MPSTEPAEVFQYNKPVQGGPTLSQEVRDNFLALAQTFYGTDPTNPAAPRIGQTRILREEPPAFTTTNVKLQWYDGSTWRDLMQRIEGGVPAPTKVIADVAAPLQVWTIDHNLGSQPLLQVFDGSRRELEAVHTFPEQVVMVARFSALALSLVPPGPPIPTRVAMPLPYNGAILSAFAMVDEPIGPAPFSVDFAINGTPITGGTIPVPPAAPPGPAIPGAPVTAANLFSIGQGLDVLITAGAPIVGGAIDVFLVLQRTLNPGQYLAEHVTDNRVVITHSAPTVGRAIILG